MVNDANSPASTRKTSATESTATSASCSVVRCCSRSAPVITHVSPAGGAELVELRCTSVGRARGAAALDQRLDHAHRALVRRAPPRSARAPRASCTSWLSGTPFTGVASAVSEVLVRVPGEAHADRRAAVGLAQLARLHAAEPALQRALHRLHARSRVRRAACARASTSICGCVVLIGVAHVGERRAARCSRTAHASRPTARLGEVARAHLHAHQPPLAADQRPELRLAREVERERAPRRGRAPRARSRSANSAASAPSGTGMSSCAVADVPGSAPASTSSSVAMPMRA